MERSQSPVANLYVIWSASRLNWPRHVRGLTQTGRRTILCDNDPTFVLYRISQRFGLPVVPGWADWFNNEINRRGAIKPLVGLGCSPVLVSGTKKLFLKWIRSALRQKRVEVPDFNGPVSWSLEHSFFRAGDDQGAETIQELGEDNQTSQEALSEPWSP